jgi:transcriptional regulator with XRE-family HTH domain
MTALRDSRKRLNLTQAELAAKLGLHQTSVSRMETGDLEVDERTRLAVEALIIMKGRRRGRSVSADVAA